ncbi:MAG: ParB N-terminal domain-containing protein [Tepidisphaeraceae bacterium]
MHVETAAIEGLSADPANARKHGERNLEAIAASLRRFGQQKPIVVDTRGVVRAGNGTLAAAKSLGWTHIDVVRSNLPVSELTAFSIADNRTAELAEWDADVLGKLAEAGELKNLGFDDDELQKFIGKPEENFDSVALPDGKFEVVVECRDEEQQKEIYQRLTAEGLQCRLFTL